MTSLQQQIRRQCRCVTSPHFPWQPSRRHSPPLWHQHRCRGCGDVCSGCWGCNKQTNKREEKKCRKKPTVTLTPNNNNLLETPQKNKNKTAKKIVMTSSLLRRSGRWRWRPADSTSVVALTCEDSVTTSPYDISSGCRRWWWGDWCSVDSLGLSGSCQPHSLCEIIKTW